MMGIVPFSFNDVNKDIQERETVWGGEHKESRREERDTKKVRKIRTQRRGRGRETNILRIKNLHRAEISLNEHKSPGQRYNSD